jgi:hypothetical protein
VLTTCWQIRGFMRVVRTSSGGPAATVSAYGAKLPSPHCLTRSARICSRQSASRGWPRRSSASTSSVCGASASAPRKRLGNYGSCASVSPACRQDCGTAIPTWRLTRFKRQSIALSRNVGSSRRRNLKRQIAQGLDGSPREAAKARLLLRELFGGKIRLVPGADKSLWAHYKIHPAVLVRGAGTCGSGGSLLNWKSLKAKELRLR